MSIEERLNINFDQLNNNERIILQKIIENKSDFYNLTIYDFAKKSYVSKSFVIRLCKKIGYTGYSEFKYQLKSEVENTTKKQSTQSILKITEDDLKETLRLLSAEKLEQLNKVIQHSTHIYTYGTGYGQKTILEDFKRGVILNQRIVTSLPTSVELKLYTNKIAQGDIIIIVSMSGKIDSIRNSLILMKENGAQIISITKFKTNDLASLASLNLYVQSTPINNPSSQNQPYTSYASLCLLLDIIVKECLL